VQRERLRDARVSLAGGCHCGNIRLTLSGVPEDAKLAVRECGCTFCQKHGGLWMAPAGARLTVAIAQPADVARYAFGTRTADFLVCRTCGVVSVVTSRIAERLYAVVSVRAFEGIAPERLERRAVDFEGEELAERLARRTRNWIADVEFL
jgi:hypothetical protein